MKRYVFYILGCLALLFGLSLTFACYWLTATPTGADWLIRTLANRAPETFSVQSVEGRLTDELILSDVEFHWNGGQIAIGQVGWRWRAAGLLHRNVRIHSLNIEDVTLVTQPAPDTPDTPSDLYWPQLPGWLHKLHISFDEIQVRRLTWKQPDVEPFYVEGLATKARWAHSKLRIPWLTALCDAGAISARLEGDWRRQRLQLLAAALLKTSPDNHIPLIMAGYAQTADQPKTLTGKIHLSAHTAVAGGWQIATPYVLAPTDVKLGRFELRSLTGSGTLLGKAHLDWAQSEPTIDLTADIANLDLKALTGQATDLSGDLLLKGGLKGFEGQLSLTNQAPDWRKLKFETTFSGSGEIINFSRLKILALDGEIDGNLSIRRTPQLEFKGKLTSHDLNPAAAGMAWPARINLQAQGSWIQQKSAVRTAILQAKLLPSSLRGHPLRGSLDARLQGEDLQLQALELQTRGVNVSAKGRLRQRIVFNAKVDDLAGLLPELSGAVQGQGWIRRQDGRFASQVTGTGRSLRYEQLSLQRMDFTASLAENRSGSLKADLTGLKRGALNIPALALQGRGVLDKHNLSAQISLPHQARIELAAAGAYAASSWQGTLTNLAVQDPVGTLLLTNPTALSLSDRGFLLDSLRLTGKTGEQLTALAKLQFSPLVGNTALTWENLKLAHAQPWLGDVKLTGNSSGKGAWRQTAKGGFDLFADTQATGRFEKEHFQLELDNAEASLSWNPDRLNAGVKVSVKDGGQLQGSVAGGRSDGMTLPQQTNWKLICDGLNLQRLSPWLPPDIKIKGILSAKSEGQLLADHKFVATGQMKVTDGHIQSHKTSGKVVMPVQTADINWSWREQNFTGTTNLQLGDYGRLSGRYRLPLPARLPVKPTKQGALDISVEGRSAELGLLSIFMPGLVQESRGSIEFNLHAKGTWENPRLNGQARLIDAGAYLPVAGIELQDIGLVARLDENRILLDSLSLRSGEGTLRGTGSLQLQDWKPGNYDLNFKGTRVQLINLSELQVLADPDLRLTGNPAGLKVSGQIGLPEVMIRDNKKPSVITPSEDVIIIGRQIEQKKTPDFNIQADVKLLLGDHVLVKASGLDARLSGALRLTAIGAKALNAEGRISVAEGQYAAYGTRLDITRGNLLFNGPLDQPTLDILALRTIGKVKAGVQVSGTPRAPVVKLTSEPAMSDSDRLAYIVLGRATARNAGEADLLMTAGGVLLSQGESVVLRDRLKRSLGVDVLGIEQGSAQNNVSGSMLTIGKYLSPSLYVSIGQSLFTNTQAFRLRYSLGERWELESTTGEESGVDLFYKIEFR